MALPMPPPSNPMRLALLPEHCDAVLRELARPEVVWDDVASVALRDPAMLHALFAAAPLARRRLADCLKEAVASRLQRLGADLLRAWFAQQLWSAPEAGGDLGNAVAASLQIAEYAFHLARQTGYAYPDEAYLAGLWCRLADLGAGPARARGVPVDGAFDAIGDDGATLSPAALTARLAACCEAPAPLIDALALEGALEEQLRTAHPLVRLLWSARKLARDDWRVQIEALARLTALDTDALSSLRTDADFLARQQSAGAQSAAPPPPSSRAPGTAVAAAALPAPADLGGDPLRMAALSGMLRSGFDQCDEALVRSRFALACRLLCRTAPPLVVTADETGRLGPLPLGSAEDIDEPYRELGQRIDDDVSIVALALRTGEPTSRFAGSAQPGRSLHDWHISRWLGGDGFLCLPLQTRAARVAAIIGVASGTEPDASTRALLTALAGAAADALIGIGRQAALERRLADEIGERYREHARRLAHEARNPLTIIKTYLDLMAQRESQGGTLDEGIKVLHAELDRLGRLIQQGAEVPVARAEPQHCGVAEVLHDLRALYAEALFASRGIHFELRTTPALPPAAMPASALKQVLLNLFRNAAEALDAGGRFSVVVPGQLLANGVSCIEIRLIDNGPGLPAERLSDLFAPRPSSKRDDHQGLGLAIVNDILQQWHAYIVCRSQPGTGTGFQLLVPIAESR
ncbi:MAG TPA: ATP-binding protein [Rhodocyclaceae bacterium]|nr:ATP-binding protein [Rhodocyclaceae bacterium]